MLLAFCLRRCTEASEASVICTLEVRAPQANKKKTSTNKSRAKQAQAQAKDKCRRRQIQAPQAAKPNTRRFGAQKSTGQCGEKIEPCFCEGKLRGSTFGSLPKNEGVRLSPNPICADRAAFAAQSHRQAQLVLPAACCRRRASSARREGAARTFFGAGLPGECLRATRGLVGPQNYPLFLRPENNGAQRPIVFRWVLAPDSHGGKSCHYKLRASPAKATMELPFARNYPAATSELLLSPHRLAAVY